MMATCRKTLLGMGGVLLAAVLLAACGPDGTAVARVVRELFSGNTPLSPAAQVELSRLSAIVGELSVPSSGPEVQAQIEHFQDAFSRVRDGYVRPVEDEILLSAAIEGARKFGTTKGTGKPADVVEAALDSMLSKLDPHTLYLNAREFGEMQISTTGRFGGLGIEVTQEDGHIRVIAPIEDTPAARAGIQPGDLITHVDAEPIEGVGLTDAVGRMRGPPGTSVRLTIKRGEQLPFVVALERAAIRVRPVKWRLEGSVGYLRVAGFNEQVQTGVEQAMEALRAEAGGKLSGIVLDLRNNPGGLLDASLWLSDAFLTEGTILEVRGRFGANVHTYRATRGDLAAGLPVLVLINGGSASASEIVAGALQDLGRARVMGARSFGKGSVQTIMPMSREGALKLTTQLYYTPSGQSIQAWGVIPDIQVMPAEPTNLRRESDNPNALPADHKDDGKTRLEVSENDCPSRVDGDRLLGCALLFMATGQDQAFMGALKKTP